MSFVRSCDDTGKGQNHIPASAKNHTVGREKEEQRNPQEPKPLISTPEITWSTARAGGPCRAPTPGVMSRWNRDITPLPDREVSERPAPPDQTH